MKHYGLQVYVYAVIALFLALMLMFIPIADSMWYERPAQPVHGYGSGLVKLQKFSSGEDLVKAFKNSSANWYYCEDMAGGPVTGSATNGNLKQSPGLKSGDYSTTNIQVEGVDEADTVKTDGRYIYLIANGSVSIVNASTPGDARVVSTTSIGNFSPAELFVSGGRMMVIGSISLQPFDPCGAEIGYPVKDCPRPWPHLQTSSIRLYDISDRENIQLLRTFDLEGSYKTSRLIGDTAYLVVNTYPDIWLIDGMKNAEDIIPLCRENGGSFKPAAEPTDIGYIPPVSASSFTTIAAISMSDKDKGIVKETIAGNGQNVYASLDNLYIAQSCPGYYILRDDSGESVENTTVTKFELRNGDVKYASTGKVKGHVLNQFSMDEHNGYFRIATTLGEVWDSKNPSANNVYVLDSSMNVVGALEDLAPGEKIYSARFMGDRCYMVTFKKVDPLFVIDLSDPRNPDVLGKLKIPGYSDYLHPYDETHLIGIGKDAVDASESDTSSRGLDFAWYQGIKMAIFDVSDVNNPVEMHKVVIGDRGTDSPVLSNHKALLFDREKGLLVIPITLAEIKGEKTALNQHGEYVFQGAYVYDVGLQNGFDLRGRVTQYDSDEVFRKSGYYFHGDRSITRSLYIGDVLYTLSDKMLQLNDLDTLQKIKALEL